MRDLGELIRRWSGLAKEMKSYSTNKVHLVIDRDIIENTIDFLKIYNDLFLSALDKVDERKC